MPKASLRELEQEQGTNKESYKQAQYHFTVCQRQQSSKTMKVEKILLDLTILNRTGNPDMTFFQQREQWGSKQRLNTTNIGGGESHNEKIQKSYGVQKIFNVKLVPIVFLTFISSSREIIQQLN